MQPAAVLCYTGRAMNTPDPVRMMLRRVRRIRQRIRKHPYWACAGWLVNHRFACPVCHDGGVCPVALEVWKEIRRREQERVHFDAIEQRRREADPEHRRVMGMCERAAIRQGYSAESIARYKVRDLDVLNRKDLASR